MSGKYSKPIVGNFPNTETGKVEQEKMVLKTDKTGAVTDVLHSLDADKEPGGKHGHVWNLATPTPDEGDKNAPDIGARREVRPSKEK